MVCACHFAKPNTQHDALRCQDNVSSLRHVWHTRKQPLFQHPQLRPTTAPLNHVDSPRRQVGTAERCRSVAHPQPDGTVVRCEVRERREGTKKKRTVKQLSISVFDFPVTRSILQKWSALSKTTCRFKVGCTSWRRNLKFRHTDHADLVWCVTVCLCYSLPHHFNAAIQRHTHPRWRQRETSMSSLPCLGSWLRVQ
jgi:hypothetical protein